MARASIVRGMRKVATAMREGDLFASCEDILGFIWGYETLRGVLGTESVRECVDSRRSIKKGECEH